MKIENWRKHLKQMKTGYYEIDGKIGQLMRFRFIGANHIRFDFNTRSYEYSCEEAPYKLATWRPVNEDGKASFDHIAAEALLQTAQPEVPTVEAEEMPHDDQLINTTPNANNLPTIVDPDQLSLDEAIEASYKTTMQSITQGTQFANEELRKVILRLKGINGKEFVAQAKQIVNAINATSKVRDSAIEFYKTGVSLLKEQQKSKPKDGNTDNNHPKD